MQLRQTEEIPAIEVLIQFFLQLLQQEAEQVVVMILLIRTLPVVLVAEETVMEAAMVALEILLLSVLLKEIMEVMEVVVMAAVAVEPVKQATLMDKQLVVMVHQTQLQEVMLPTPEVVEVAQEVALLLLIPVEPEVEELAVEHFFPVKTLLHPMVMAPQDLLTQAVEVEVLELDL